MTPASRPSALARLAQVALGVSAVVFLWTLVTAVRLTATEPLLPSTDTRADSLGVAFRQPATEGEIARAVSHDVFSALRESTPRRERTDAAPMAVSNAESSASVDTANIPTVKGTATGANGDAFAMCALPGADAIVVRVGDVIGSYTVVSIERARVVFRDAAGRRHIVEANASPAGDER